MAFVKVDKGHRPAYTKTELEIRMGVHNQSKEGATRGIYFSISEGVINQVGWDKVPAADNTDRAVCPCEVQEGVGDDAGFLLLTSAEPGMGYALGTSSVHARSFSMNIAMSRLKHYTFGDPSAPADAVEFTVDEKEKTILIQCPDWLRYDPSSYTPPPRQLPPKIPAQETKPVPPTRAVASGVKEIVKEVAKDIGFPNRKIRRAAVAAVTKSMQ